MMAERICVTTDRVEDYSAEFIITCDALDFGCNGGHLETTMQFMKEGLPRSDQYQSDSECDQIPVSAKCKKIVHSEGAEIIKSEIKSGGPVTANMIVFKDLLDYESGIYEAD
jgi:cathepsin B